MRNRTPRNSASELTNPLETVKKHVRLWNRSILMSELGVRPKLRFWAKMSKKQTRKIELQPIQLLSSSTPRNGKKTCQALESLNSNVRARSLAQITIFGLDEQETDATLTNSTSELMNPLEMVKKHVWLWNRSILVSELGVRPKLRFWA